MVIGIPGGKNGKVLIKAVRRGEGINGKVHDITVMGNSKMSLIVNFFHAMSIASRLLDLSLMLKSAFDVEILTDTGKLGTQ